jgi:hypothetical protein
MTEEVSTSRGARSRRTMAILAWTGLVIVAVTLWVCRQNGAIQSYTTEPIALMLSAYAAFVSIFSWMLFAPGRRALKESPELFFSAAVTLLPPCVIAFHLMPPESAFRGWLTLGLFMFSTIAVLSPVPEEFFAIPRERQSYLRPISGGVFAGVDFVSDTLHFESLHFESLQVGRPQPRRQPKPEPDYPRAAADPWRHPFADTGTAPTEPRASTLPSRSAPDNPPPHPLRTVVEASASPSLAPTTIRPDNAEDDLSLDRMQDELGGELIEGTIKVRFEPGQKRAQLHIPFSPPLPGVPDVECEAIGDHVLRVKVPVRQTYGIRIEARRSDTSASLETEVGFSANYSPPNRHV